MQPLRELAGKHPGETCYIICKGPSLAYLEKKHIGEGIVITLAESILKIEEIGIKNTIYSLQKDGCNVMDFQPCTDPTQCHKAVSKVAPKNGIPVLLHTVESMNCLKNYEPKYLFDCKVDLDCEWNTFSTIVAMKIAAKMGCTKIVLVSADAYVTGDINNVALTKDFKRQPDFAYLYQKAGFEQSAISMKMPVEYFIPAMPKPEKKNLPYKLIIATPYYELKGYSPYIKSLVHTVAFLTANKVNFEYWDVCGDSYVERAKNTLAMRFLESDATDFMMIDSDMSWDLQGFLNLIKVPVEFISGTYPIKNNWESYCGCLIVNDDMTPKIDKKTGLICADWVPGGFMKIKRAVFEKYIEAYPFDFYYDSSADPQNPMRKYYNFFNCQIVNGMRAGEDKNFCDKVKAFGTEIFVQPDISFEHFGVQAWKGNYHQYLLKQPRPEGTVAKEIKEEAKGVVDAVINTELTPEKELSYTN